LQGFQYIGVALGADIVQHNPTPNLTVDASAPALIYDQTAQRITWSSTQVIDTTLDENGSATAVTTSGNEKWLAVFAEFERLLTDPRTDGYGNTVFFNRAESFKINVVQGVEAPTGTAVKPGLRGDQILIGDVLIDYGMTQILNADIDQTRAEYPYDLTGSPTAVRAKSMQEALQDILDTVNGFTGANNIFTGDNTFSAGLNANGVLALGVASLITMVHPTAYATPRLALATNFNTDLPTDMLCLAQFGSNSSGTGNIRCYAYLDGFIITLGAQWTTSHNWVFDTGVTSALALRIAAGEFNLQQHDGSSPWVDAAWSDNWFKINANGATIDDGGNAGLFRYGAVRAGDFSLALPNAISDSNLTTGLPDWVYIYSAGSWESRVYFGFLTIPIPVPFGIAVTAYLDVYVNPGAARSGSDRIRVGVYQHTYGTGYISPLVENVYDDGTSDAQTITASFSLSGSNANVSVFAQIRAGSDGHTNNDYVISARLRFNKSFQEFKLISN